MSPNLRRAAVLGGGGLLCVVALLCARMLLGGRAELRAADVAGLSDDIDGRILHLRRAMAYYLPGNPFVRRAEWALRQEAWRAEARGQSARALDILHQLRSAILSMRGLHQPFASDLPEINQRIAELSAAQREAAVGLRGRAGMIRALKRLERPPAPDRLWTVIGLLGFILYTGGGLLLFMLGLRRDAGRGPQFLKLLAVVVLGLVLFALGMAWA
jgi:hypothetical protein